MTGKAGPLTFAPGIASTTNAQALRSRAAFYRSLATDAEDLRIKMTLLQLAEEFEREASDVAGHREEPYARDAGV